MKIYNIIFLLITGAFTALFIANQIQAQSAAKIENIKFDAEGSKLAITYDIAKFKEGETFEIWVKIVTASGKTLVPVTMYGDVNKGVSGGTGKRIVWDVEADNAALDEEFSVEVYGRADGNPDSQVSKEPSKEITEKGKSGNISVFGAILLSDLLPGLGRRVVKGSGSQWLLGVGVYGMVAGSIVLHRSAINVYEDYKFADNANERDDYFKKAENYVTYSKILMGSAIAIWAADMIWTGILAGKARKNSNPKVSFNYYYDSYLNEPLFGLSYRF
jgi:hypothetical protein